MYFFKKGTLLIFLASLTMRGESSGILAISSTYQILLDCCTFLLPLISACLKAHSGRGLSCVHMATLVGKWTSLNCPDLDRNGAPVLPDSMRISNKVSL